MNAQQVQDITVSTIYLMGGTFALGSLFTVSLILILEFIRRDKDKEPEQPEQ